MASDEQSPVEPIAASEPAPGAMQPAPALPDAAAPVMSDASGGDVELDVAKVVSATPAAEGAAAAPAPAKPGMFAGMTARIKANPRRSAMWAFLILLLVVGFVWPPVSAPHASLGGEQAFAYGPHWLTNSLVTTFLVDIVLIVLALIVTATIKLVPSGVQNALEMVMEYFMGLAEQVAGKAARSYFPWIMTIFFFVIISNWSGLIPGVGSIGWESSATEAQTLPSRSAVAHNDAQLAMADGNLILLAPGQTATEATAEPAGAEHEGTFVPSLRAPSADLNMTFALAILTMALVQILGVRALGASYFSKFFNISGKGYMKGMNLFVGILELISELSRILTFGFRLFGNIFAGEIVLATMAFLGAFLLPVPFYILEVFIGFVQALVFTMLALVFFSMATAGHHDDSAAAAH